jgi:hypothetical protein
MPILQVSQILGHSSVTITEKHYLPRVQARQGQLNDAVIASWQKQGIHNPDPKPRRRSGRPAPMIPIAETIAVNE